MKTHYKIILLLGVMVAFSVFPIAHAQNDSAKYKLKPGGYGKLCQGCHADFQGKMKKAYVHTPLKKGECTGCHNPHTASHGKLLEADTRKICLRCHGGVIPAGAASTHKVVAEGECMKCHDPHSSANRDNLLKGGNALCFDCHKAMGNSLAKIKHKHNPVEKGCTTCHDPHASAKGEYLLKGSINALCTGCHKTDRPIFARKHMNYPVTSARCTSCHDPHGSDLPGILYNNVHRPVASRMCNQCHGEATSANPLKTKREGNELCKGCHNDMFNKTFARSRVHSPLLAKQGCLSCHSPHASKEKGLLMAPKVTLCGRCHADTIRRQEKSVTKHEPVMNGDCGSCHDPHSSDSQFLAKQPSVIDLCATCHDWMKHSTHPIGDKIKDPRNKNLTLNCLSCHRSHGTEFKGMMPYPSVSELCVQCHQQYRR